MKLHYLIFSIAILSIPTLVIAEDKNKKIMFHHKNPLQNGRVRNLLLLAKNLSQKRYTGLALTPEAARSNNQIS